MQKYFVSNYCMPVSFRWQGDLRHAFGLELSKVRTSSSRSHFGESGETRSGNDVCGSRGGL